MTIFGNQVARVFARKFSINGEPIRKVVAALGLSALAAYSSASPINITQTFSDALYNDYGVTSGVAYGQVPTGDWIFTGTVDSNAVNLSLWAIVGAFQLSSLTLTQASLGLFNIGIVNAPILFFYPDRFGFAYDIYTASPWTVIVYEPDHFSSAQTLDEYLALLTPPPVNDSYTGFGPQWKGFLLADGRSLYGVGNGIGLPSVSAAAVSEPGSLVLLLVVLGLLMAGHGLGPVRL